MLMVELMVVYLVNAILSGGTKTESNGNILPLAMFLHCSCTNKVQLKKKSAWVAMVVCWLGCTKFGK